MKKIGVRRDNYTPRVQFIKGRGPGGKVKWKSKMNNNPAAVGPEMTLKRFRSANTHPGKRGKSMRRSRRG